MALTLHVPNGVAYKVGPGTIWSVDNSVSYTAGQHVEVFVAYLPADGSDVVISSSMTVSTSGPFTVQGWIGWNWNTALSSALSWSDFQHPIDDLRSVQLGVRWTDASYGALGSLDVLGFEWHQDAGLWENLKQMRAEIAGAPGGLLEEIHGAVIPVYHSPLP